jgi:hypothetical protein
LSFWFFQTRRGKFSIVKLARGGVDLYFEDLALGYYRDEVGAADDAGGGHHYSLPCYPEDGRSLRVSREIADWTFVRR